ncbi:MAG TPA: GAF domain-containing sensor histidine kinase [Verrucomicrobiae bacterium]|nr:GAF domain-containing sensor histidine kinase [Terriglobales bacterium]HXU20167.1 GAF domain-containing sensor histidine kinase [Verrucomicrobiae bacterium]
MAQALSQRLPTSEAHVLKLLSQGAPMVEVLHELCNFIDAKSPGVIPTVLLPDSDGHLRLAAGPKVPRIWNEAFDGMKLHSYASFLSMAGHEEGPVPVADMRSDPSFAACWDLALSQGVQAAWSVPILSKERKILGTLILFYPTPQPPGERDLELMELVIHMAAIAIERHRSEEELHAYCSRLHHSQDEERRRIARELHDSTGQKLAVLTMNLSLVRDRIPTQPREIETAFSQCISLATSISDELRTLSYLLHPPLLDDCGLETAIQWYVSGINQRNGLHVEAEIAHELRRLTEEAELAIFRVVQASLTNVHLHSKATQATIKIEQNSDEVIVTVRDNGKGIADGVLDHSSRVKTVGVGIAGMRERMEQLGGRLEIETSCCGTKVNARVPKTHFRAAT